MSVSLFVCLCVCLCLSASVSPELHVRSSPMAVAQSSSGASLRYVMYFRFMDDVVFAR